MNDTKKSDPTTQTNVLSELVGDKESDLTTQTNVLSELDWDPEIEPTEINVRVNHGVVTLSGRVDSFAKMLATEASTKRVAGVRAVVNDLAIKGFYHRTDTDIASAVASALELTTLVPRSSVKVMVKDGEVELSGRVRWGYQRHAAAEAVQYVTGIRGLVNEITINQPMVEPETVRAAILDALVRSAQVDANQVTVEVEDGHVYLTGNAQSWAERSEVSTAAWKSAGVTDVTNQMKVDYV